MNPSFNKSEGGIRVVSVALWGVRLEIMSLEGVHAT